MAYFRHDLHHSREILLPEWKRRPWSDRLKESLAHLISPMY